MNPLPFCINVLIVNLLGVLDRLSLKDLSPTPIYIIGKSLNKRLIQTLIAHQKSNGRINIHLITSTHMVILTFVFA